MMNTQAGTEAAVGALQRRLERLGLTDHDDWADRYLLCEHVVNALTARPRQRFEAVARFVRDLVAHRWIKTRQAREAANPKRVYYLSMEFLIGRALSNNIMNLALDPVVERQLQRDGWMLADVVEEEPDAWLRQPDPWQVPRPGKEYNVSLNASVELSGSCVRIVRGRPSMLIGVAHDRPVIGYGSRCVNTLRLWAATAP